jgi:hypothetical protein
MSQVATNCNRLQNEWIMSKNLQVYKGPWLSRMCFLCIQEARVRFLSPVWRNWI